MCYSKLEYCPTAPKVGDLCTIKSSTSCSFNLDDLLSNAIPLSKGAQGQIFKCKVDAHKTLLLKKFPKTNTSESSPFSNEVNALLRLSHPQIPTIVQTFESQNSFYLVREHVEGIDLLSYLNSFHGTSLAEDKIYSIFKQLLSLVSYCHTKGVFHCDIKLDNIIINNDKVYLIDFGLATLSSFSSSASGTLKYTAPEVLLHQMHSSALQDAWSCGVVLYALSFGSLPFDSPNEKDCFEKIIGNVLPQYPAGRGCSNDLKNVLTCLLRKNPSQRSSVDQILSHSLFNQSKTCKVSYRNPTIVKKSNSSMFNRVIRV